MWRVRLRRPQGFVGAGLTSWGHISASDVYQPRLDVMTSLGAACRANSEMAAHADTIFVAVKPGQVAGVLAEIAPTLDQSRHVLVSIAAGVTIETLEGALADAGTPDAKVVRVMPNTPCFVGETASAYALGRRATPEDGAAVEKLMGAVGTIHKVRTLSQGARARAHAHTCAHVWRAIQSPWLPATVRSGAEHPDS